MPSISNTSLEEQSEELPGKDAIRRFPSETSTCTEGLENLSRLSTSESSVPSSHKLYAEPTQTLLFLDWDDTLFPTTELLERRGIKISSDEPIPQACEDELRQWRAALMECLLQARALSERCVIVTNSQRPWVEQCAARFVPELLPLLGQDGVEVVYARERSPKAERRPSKLKPVRHSGKYLYQEEAESALTIAKYAAMKDETARFYSRYPGQSWKNIVSMGDMHYERRALQEVTFRRQGPPKENVRTKTVVLPAAPSLSELALQLQFSRLMLLAYIKFDGDFDLDVSSSFDPLLEIGCALNMPEIAGLRFSRHAWGLEPLPSDPAEVPGMLEDLAITVQNSIFG